MDYKKGLLDSVGMRLDPGLHYCSALTCVGQWLLGCALSWVSTKAAVGSMTFSYQCPNYKIKEIRNTCHIGILCQCKNRALTSKE